MYFEKKKSQNNRKCANRIYLLNNILYKVKSILSEPIHHLNEIFQQQIKYILTQILSILLRAPYDGN